MHLESESMSLSETDDTQKRYLGLMMTDYIDV